MNSSTRFEFTIFIAPHTVNPESVLFHCLTIGNSTAYPLHDALVFSRLPLHTSVRCPRIFSQRIERKRRISDKIVEGQDIPVPYLDVNAVDVERDRDGEVHPPVERPFSVLTSIVRVRLLWLRSVDPGSYIYVACAFYIEAANVLRLPDDKSSHEVSGWSWSDIPRWRDSCLFFRQHLYPHTNRTLLEFGRFVEQRPSFNRLVS